MALLSSIFDPSRTISPRQILLRYTLAVSLIFVTVTISHYSAQFVLSAQDSLANAINKSGRQRMLSQRIQLQISKFAESGFRSTELRDQLIQTADEFRDAHAELTALVRLRSSMEDNLYLHYFGNTGVSLDVASQRFFELSQDIALSVNAKNSLAQFNAFDSEGLLAELNNAVIHFEALAIKSGEDARFWADFSYRVALVILALEVLFIFLPIHLMNKNNIQRLQRKNKDLIQSQIQAQKAAEEAKEASAVKTKFLANMSHELRTPLNGIVGLSEDLKETKRLPVQFRETVQTIHQSAIGLQRIVRNILDITEMDKNGIAIQAIEFNLRSLIDDTVSNFEFEIFAKELKFCLQIDPSLGEIYEGDKKRLSQLLSHLLENAIKFTDEGTIEFSVNKLSDSQVAFEIADTGIGLSSEAKRNIFNAFQKDTHNKTSFTPGVGVGLTLCKSIAIAHGGEIYLDETREHGCRFKVILPLCEVAAKSDKTANKFDKPETLTGSVLVVDDTKTNRLVMKKYLKETRFKVFECEDGLQALNLTKDQNFDLILMDLSMPVMDGLVATEKIHQHQVSLNRPKTPILAITANAYDHDRQACKAVGMTGFLAKPVRKDGFLKIVARVMNAPDGAFIT